MFISTRNYLKDLKAAEKRGYEKALEEARNEQEHKWDVRSCHEHIEDVRRDMVKIKEDLYSVTRENSFLKDVPQSPVMPVECDCNCNR